MITINLLNAVQKELKDNGRCYADIKEVFISGKYDIFKNIHSYTLIKQSTLITIQNFTI